jgi:hypothetical protein
MTPVRGIRAGGALALLLLVPQLAPAAWENVFQVTCFGCKKRPVTAAYFAPAPSCSTCAPACPCPEPCPCPTTTAFVQRTYYQPVTTFQAETRFEPVTSVRTSFFWEPVTSCHCTSFFDPCTCSCRQVCTPVTSFRLRSQCNTVTNYVARVCYRPVTTFRQSCYMEAVQVPACPPPCPPPCTPGSTAPVAAVPPIGTVPGTTTAPPLNLGSEPPPAGLSEQRSLPPAGLSEQRDYMPPATGQSYRPGIRPTTPPPSYKPERVASLPGGGSTVTGQVVRGDFAPRAGAKVTFVNAQRQDVRQAATADAAGRFHVSLASGHWFVYVDDTYHNQLDVRGDARPVTVMTR